MSSIDRMPGRTGHRGALLVLAYPSVMLGIFLVLPFCILIALSFYYRVPGGTYEPAFVLDNFTNLAKAF
ncbi:MAG: hypothetical protein MI806_08640, partial [Minwuiales bacterium]|nr:hypothetical protein [Minwuiales bacterium]